MAKPLRPQPPQPQSPTAEKVSPPSLPDNVGIKESWRKSDSTDSHTTVRPGGNGGSARTSRPVSLAESFQSTHTVVQVSNKRLSALITDGMPEEDDEFFVSCGDNSGIYPSSPLALKHRRSMSLNLAPNKNIIPPPLASTSMAELKQSCSPVASTSTILGTFPASPTQKLTHTPSSRSFSGRQPQTSTVDDFRGKFATWANVSSDNVSSLRYPQSNDDSPFSIMQITFHAYPSPANHNQHDSQQFSNRSSQTSG